jgi:hypothetical protein
MLVSVVVGLGLELSLACQPQQPREVRGLIVDVVPRDLRQADQVTLRTESGEILVFRVADSVLFPPSHLREHMLFAEPGTVTYRLESDQLVATSIGD